jgi:hypothetical protein
VKKPRKNIVTKLENLLVEQRAIRCVEVRRTISLEVPAGCRDPYWIQRFIAQGDPDFGPFLFEPIEGSESDEIFRTRVIGVTKEAADIPHVERSES